MTPPEQKHGLPASRHLVFTSAGDYSHLESWIKGRRNFDLWVTYYGDRPGRYQDVSDYYLARKAGKFPNLHFAWKQWRTMFDRYEAVLVLDDDLRLDATSISRLFEIRAEHDLWLLQPAYDPRGRISHPITRVRPFSFLRHTNFVELGCPLFRRDKLDCFLQVYDPVLVGWGIDWWFLHALSPAPDDKIAIVDVVSCFNPPEQAKDGRREIDLLQDRSTRERTWLQIQQKLGIPGPEKGFVEYRILRKPFTAADVLHSIHHGWILTGLTVAKLWRRAARRVSMILGTDGNREPGHDP